MFFKKIDEFIDVYDKAARAFWELFIRFLALFLIVFFIFMVVHAYRMLDGSKDHQQLESAYKNGYEIIYKNQKISSKLASSEILDDLKYNKDILFDKNNKEKTITVINAGSFSFFEKGRK